MSATKHTPGPWIVGELSLDIITPKGQPVCSPSDNFDEAQWAIDARRIVACVNYCEGVSTAEIEAAPKSMNLRALLDAFDSVIATRETRAALAKAGSTS